MYVCMHEWMNQCMKYMHARIFLQNRHILHLLNASFFSYRIQTSSKRCYIQRWASSIPVPSSHSGPCGVRPCLLQRMSAKWVCLCKKISRQIVEILSPLSPLPYNCKHFSYGSGPEATDPHEPRCHRYWSRRPWTGRRPHLQQQHGCASVGEGVGERG